MYVICISFFILKNKEKNLNFLEVVKIKKINVLELFDN